MPNALTIYTAGELKYSIILAPVFALLGANLVHAAYDAVVRSKRRGRVVSVFGLAIVLVIVGSYMAVHIKDDVGLLSRHNDYSVQETAAFLV